MNLHKNQVSKKKCLFVTQIDGKKSRDPGLFHDNIIELLIFQDFLKRKNLSSTDLSAPCGGTEASADSAPFCPCLSCLFQRPISWDQTPPCSGMFRRVN